MDFRRYLLEPVPQTVQLINDKLVTLTMDSVYMYLMQQTTFANRDEVDEVLQEKSLLISSSKITHFISKLNK